MSPSELSQRFQKNPWPWLILLLTISLGLMWVRENHVLQKEIIGEYPRNVAGATPALHMMFLAPPKFVDPFGNVYSFHASHYDWLPALKPASYHFRLVVTSRNLDRTAGRMFTVTQDGHDYEELKPRTDLVLPATFSALLLTFTALWISNTRRQRQQT